MIEAISATGRTIPLYIILASKKRMQNWFNSSLESQTTLDTSESGFTNDRIGVL
jgi:DDE superfamily endonuclease